MGYLIKMLIKKGILCLLSFHGNLWGPEKGHGTFCKSSCHYQAALTMFLPQVMPLTYTPVHSASFLAFTFKRVALCNSLPGLLGESAGFCGP